MPPWEVDGNQVVGTASKAFEDGLYFVFPEDVQQKSLDETVFAPTILGQMYPAG